MLEKGFGNDMLYDGGPGDDYINTNRGSDRMVLGREGNDILIGGSGIDELFGGGGNDVLEGGGGGNDILNGEGEDDTIITVGGLEHDPRRRRQRHDLDRLPHRRATSTAATGVDTVYAGNLTLGRGERGTSAADPGSARPPASRSSRTARR